jgi:hypothetical protein
MRVYVWPSTFTPFDLEASENQWIINVAFVGQAHGDIRQKSQKLQDSME